MEKKLNFYPLPNHLQKVMTNLHRLTGENRFFLYGGAPVDLILDKKNKINDFDVAFEGMDKNKINQIKNRLIKKGFDIVEPYREYIIRKNKKVILVYAKKGNVFLDLCFLDDINLVPGPFNVGHLYCRFPEQDYFDGYHALKAIRKKEIKPVRNNLDDENPYLLLSRFVNICSKYDISFINNKNNKGIILELIDKIKIKNNKIISDQYISFLASIFKSIMRSKDRLSFIKDLLDIGLFKNSFSELHSSFKKLSVADFKKINKFYKIKKRDSLIIFLSNFLTDKREKNSFFLKIDVFSIRRWE